MKPSTELVRQALSRAKGFEADGDPAHASAVHKLLTAYLNAADAYAAGGGRRALAHTGGLFKNSEAALRQFVFGGTSAADAAATNKVELANVVALTTDAIQTALDAEETRVTTMRHTRRLATLAKAEKQRSKFLEDVRPGKKEVASE